MKFHENLMKFHEIFSLRNLPGTIWDPPRGARTTKIGHELVFSLFSRILEENLRDHFSVPVSRLLPGADHRFSRPSKNQSEKKVELGKNF